MSVRIQQAIFTSVQGPQLDGYQLISKSDGVTDELARELAHWGPPHDALQDSDEEATSLNFHPLRSGDFCISRTVYAGSEYSSRAGLRVYTQMLIVPAAGLAQFENNPFSIWKAAVAGGRIHTLDSPPPALPSFSLLGRGTVLSEEELADATSVLEMDALAELATLLQEKPHVAVITEMPAEQFIAVLFHLLPSEQRSQISFSTGLKFSPRRPFRLTIAPQDPVQQKTLGRLSGMHLFELPTCANTP